jgi:pentatricopeptide repeat protein
MKFYNIKDQPEKTLELFQRMKQENLIPDEISYVLLIDALSAIGDLSLCQSLLCEIPKNFLINPWIQVGLIDLWVKFILLSID